jgi:hypothetical protein
MGPIPQGERQPRELRSYDKPADIAAAVIDNLTPIGVISENEVRQA